MAKGFKHAVKTKFHETRAVVGEHKRNLFATKKGKVLTIVLGLIVILGILTAIPVTRYAIYGKFVKKDVAVSVIDSKTKKPVTEATVTVNGTSVQSDKDGVAHVEAPVGNGGIDVNKLNYEITHQDLVVDIFSGSIQAVIELNAKGRQVEVVVTDKISGKPLADATIDSNGAKAISDKDGRATMILPPEQESWKAQATHTGYNALSVTLKDAETNKLALTPVGSIVYLSKATGKINVMRSNLDGSNAKVIVPGTGNEDEYGTSLLVSRDWRYAALLATRDSDKPKVYLVDIKEGTYSLIDEGSNARFDFVGWSGHNFVYQVYRDGLKRWDQKQESIKAYNAESRSLSTLIDSRAKGSVSWNYGNEGFNDLYLLDDELVFASVWYQDHLHKPLREKAALVSIKISTNTKRIVKEYSIASSLSLKLYEPRGIYLRVEYRSGTINFEEYEDGAVKSVTGITTDKFYSFYTTYIVSPSGNKTLWYEERDGKNSLFVGDRNAKDEQTLVARTDFLPYAWFGENDQYVLLSKNSSELYIADASGSVDQPLKVTDYHKARSYGGYGFGYGGF